MVEKKVWNFSKFIFQKTKKNVFWKKYAKWCEHLDFLGIFLVSECPELYKNVSIYMSLGQINLIFIFICRTLWYLFILCYFLFTDYSRDTRTRVKQVLEQKTTLAAASGVLILMALCGLVCLMGKTCHEEKRKKKTSLNHLVKCSTPSVSTVSFTSKPVNWRPKILISAFIDNQCIASRTNHSIEESNQMGLLDIRLENRERDFIYVPYLFYSFSISY